MHVGVGIANPQWQEKPSRHSWRMRNPQLYVSGKRPMGPTHAQCFLCYMHKVLVAFCCGHSVGSWCYHCAHWPISFRVASISTWYGHYCPLQIHNKMQTIIIYANYAWCALYLRIRDLSVHIFLNPFIVRYLFHIVISDFAYIYYI